MSDEHSSHLDATGIIFGGGVHDGLNSNTQCSGTVSAEMVVGRGRFASVWKCAQPMTAIKIFRSAGSSLEAFLYEVDILNYLNRQPDTGASVLSSTAAAAATCVAGHSGRHVTRLIDSGVLYRMDPTYSAVHCWYTMPLEGNSVKGWLASNAKKYRLALPVDVTWAITRSLFEALAFIHAAGIIHADLKPANILMAYGCTIDSPVAEIRVKLADFGASARVTDKEMDACGTTWFCSPETYSDAPTFTTAVDIWAAGCTVYEMLTNEHLIDVYDVESNYVLQPVHGDIDEDIDSDDDDMSVREDVVRTDFDILDDANDVSTGASEDEDSTERNMMIVCEKLFGRPPKETRSIFSFYNDKDEIEGVEYPSQRVEIVDLLLKRHCLGKIESPERIAEIAAFIVSCMRYRPADRITAADALRSSWLTLPMAT